MTFGAATVAACGTGAASTPPAATHTPSATATPTVPSGFTVYKDPGGYYQVDYPSTWKTSAVSGGNAGTLFDAPDKSADFLVEYITGTTVTSSDISQVTQAYFSNVSKSAGGNGTYTHIQGPSQVIIGGTSWTKEEADVNIGAGNSPLHAVILIADHSNTAYILAYAAPDFTAAQSQYFSTMLNSFTLLK